MRVTKATSGGIPRIWRGFSLYAKFPLERSQASIATAAAYGIVRRAGDGVGLPEERLVGA